MGKYVLAIDQSTQESKVYLFDDKGRLCGQSNRAHMQIISPEGWISHNMEEIYSNIIACTSSVISDTGIDSRDIICIGISNQRETTVAWNRKTGKCLSDAIVWQCSRSKDIAERVVESGVSNIISNKTGLPVSPYFPASKMAWILENVSEASNCISTGDLCLGTVDSYLIYKMTSGNSFLTDVSNASRTQLFDIFKQCWDEEIVAYFGIDMRCLPEVVDSNAFYGLTDLEGVLANPVPIYAVLGDSHASLYAHECISPGMVKATYGTGSSVMMNIGNEPVLSKSGLALTVAWRLSGEISYAMEGNINYTGAVIRWMEKDIGIINSPMETESLAIASDKEDTSCLVPAFSGLGAPYWDSGAKAILTGMTRTTGRNEIVRAGLESIAYQIDDVIAYLENDTGVVANMLHADGGAANNGYLMQFQSDLSNIAVGVPRSDGLSGYGAALIAGIRAGLYQEGMGAAFEIKKYHPSKNKEWQEEKRMLWHDAVRRCLYRNHVG